MENDVIKNFGNTVRILRIKYGYSQQEFADMCGFHRTYIGQIERGERNPSLRNIHIISSAFGITLSQLFDNFVIPNKSKKNEKYWDD